MSHSHHHSHSHQHGDDHHSHAPKVTLANQRKIYLAMLLIGGFMMVEVVGGIISGSLALIADAGHMLSDFAALFLSWIAFRLSHKKPDNYRSYGFHRMQVLAAFINGLSLLVIAIWICYHAVLRLFNPVDVLALPMMVIAVIGLLVNIAAFIVLTRDSDDNLNVHSAAMHVLGDMLGSVAAIAAGIIIYFTGWMPADPILSVLVALIIVKAGWQITKKSAHILLQGAPDNDAIAQIKTALVDEFDEVNNVHHVHLWSITNEKAVLTMHVNHTESANAEVLLQNIHQFVQTQFNISHCTVQLEHGYCSDS